MSRSFMEQPDIGDNSATQLVAGCLENIREASNFHNKLTQNDSLTVSGLGDRYFVKGSHEYILKKRLPIPAELVHQMNNMRCRFEMGLFPQICRAWVTIDCDVFMWNYDTNGDLAYFDGIPNTIVKTALAKPRPGVFQSHVQYLLVVGTVVDVVLLAVSISGGELSVIPDPLFKVDLENALVNDIVSTSDGRIFFTANDVLYELEYNDKGWFQRQCKKVNRSTNLLQTLVPFLSPVAEDIEQIVIDDSRHLLYALTKKFSIQVYDLGSQGKGCTKVTTLAIGQIMHEANQQTGGQHEGSFFSNIVRLSVLEAKHSHNLNLVATTSKGVRLYFSVLPRNVQLTQGVYLSQAGGLSQNEARAQCLRVVHVRFSPGVCPSSLYKDGPQGVYMAHSDPSTTVMATAGRDIVWAMSDLYHPNSKFFVESMNELQVSGPVWAIAVNSEVQLSIPPVVGDMLDTVSPHPFYRLHETNEEELLLFTSEALFVYEHSSPVAALREALFDKGVEGTEVARLWQQFGPTDTLVLALMLLSSEKAIDLQVKEKAARLFFSWKDDPEMVDADAVGREAQWSNNDHSIADWQTRMRSPLQASTPFGERPVMSPIRSPFSPGDQSFIHGNTYYQFKSSKRHDALYAYFTRLIAPIWNSPVAILKDGKLHSLFTELGLDWLSNKLRLLLAVIDEYSMVPKPTLPGRTEQTLQAKFSAEASSRERSSLVSLRALIISTFETLSLWSVAIGHGLTAISASLDPQALPTLAGRRVSELCSDASHLNADLIKALIKYFLGDEAGTRELSDRLRAVCPTLYSQDDALVTNATEMLERAAKQGPGSDSRRLVDTAVGLLKQSVHKLSLGAICTKLTNLHAYDAIVELAVLRAKKDDPKQLALIAYRNGLGDGDRETAEASNRREDAYRVITRALDDLEDVQPVIAAADQSVHRDLIIKTVLASDDELVHAALFRWLMHSNRMNVILQSNSSHVEQFLTHEISRGGGYKYLDLLWRFYERTNAFEKAAKLLSRLADSQMTEISLSQRFSYLSHAIICAQSSTDSSVKSTIQDMRDKLEVANIQMATKEALEKLGPEGIHTARSLDKQLFSLQDICVHYARPYNLWRVQLAIFRCASFYDQETIESVWSKIIAQDFETGASSVEQRLLTTLSDLAALYASSNYFPTEFIIITLLGKCFERRVSPDFFVSLLPKIEMSISQFLEHLTNEYRTGDPFWKENPRARQFIMDVGVVVIESFLDQPTKYETQKRSSLAEECANCVSLFCLDARSVSSAPMMEMERKLVMLNERLGMI